MKLRLFSILALVALVVGGAGTALATGFSIYEAGSRATALGCAFTATADDASATFYNAAGMSFITGQRIDLNAMVIRPDFKFSGWLSQADFASGADPQTGQAESKSYLVPGVGYVNNNNSVAFGVGVYAPFGLGVVWEDPETWVGRRISHDVQIETVYVTPAVSFKATPDLAIAVGLDFAHQKLELGRYTPEPDFGTNAIHTQIEGSSNLNVTPSLGLMYRPGDKFSLGVMYHFKKTMTFDEGTAVLDPVAGSATSWGQNLVTGLGGPEQTLGTELELPYIFSLGVSYQLARTFRAEVNYVRFGWGSLEGLNLDFENDALDQSIHLGYENSWQLRVGLELDVAQRWAIMGGYVLDNTPQPTESVSPLLPDSDRNDYSLGVIYRGSRWDVNVSYMAVIGDERSNIVNGEPVRNTTDYPIGSYTALANIFGVGFTYHF